MITRPLSELVAPDWAAALAPVEQHVHAAGAFLRAEVEAGRGYLPAGPDVLRAFTRPLADVRVLVVGQDPYPTPGHPMGLSFSVQPDVHPVPRSLANVFTELVDDLGVPRPGSGDLTGWADQGVLLLNTALTVEDGQPASHAKRGWETVTDALISLVARDPSPKAFLLWGAHAQAKRMLLPDNSGHLVLMSNHPSPLSARRPPVPFLGCGHFRATNDWLVDQGKNPIDWGLDKKIIPFQGEFGL